MSTTIVDMPKVTQMLDAGWQVFIRKNPMGAYTVRARHHNYTLIGNIAEKLVALHEAIPGDKPAYDPDFHWDDSRTLITDDFTPEQALTRMAYKVHGEIL